MNSTPSMASAGPPRIQCVGMTSNDVMIDLTSGVLFAVGTAMIMVSFA